LDTTSHSCPYGSCVHTPIQSLYSFLSEDMSERIECAFVYMLCSHRKNWGVGLQSSLYEEEWWTQTSSHDAWTCPWNHVYRRIRLLRWSQCDPRQIRPYGLI